MVDSVCDGVSCRMNRKLTLWLHFLVEQEAHHGNSSLIFLQLDEMSTHHPSLLYENGFIRCLHESQVADLNRQQLDAVLSVPRYFFSAAGRYSSVTGNCCRDTWWGSSQWGAKFYWKRGQRQWDMLLQHECGEHLLPCSDPDTEAQRHQMLQYIVQQYLTLSMAFSFLTNQESSMAYVTFRIAMGCLSPGARTWGEQSVEKHQNGDDYLQNGR